MFIMLHEISNVSHERHTSSACHSCHVMDTNHTIIASNARLNPAAISQSY